VTATHAFALAALVAAQHPSAQHPSAQHPSAQHPSAQHPSAQHPAAQHPAAKDPAAQAQTTPVYAPHIEPKSDEPAAVMQTFTKPEGFQVECFASEPQLAQPVAMWIARDGSFYVAESFRHHQGVTDIRDHMDWLDDDLRARTVEDRAAMFQKHLGDKFPEWERASERIRILRDTDGDGQADWDRVYADGFTEAATGIGAGLLERDGKVWFTCIPYLWQLEDKDGDGVSDYREKISTGWGIRVALLGHDMHGLQIGPDGRLYWSIGDRGYNVSSMGGVKIANPFTGAVLRSNLDGTGLEVFATGLRNPQELAFDDYGELWTGDNNSDGGDLARWVLVVDQGETGWRQAYQWLLDPNLRGAWNDEKLWNPHFEGQAAYIVPPIANVANGPSGLACYPGTGLPAKYAGHFFLCNFSGSSEWSGVYDVSVKPKGSAYEIGPVERFVWRPLATDCDFGWEGGLYVTDWVAGWNQTGKGRIWRFSEPASSADPIVKQVKDLMRSGMKGRPFDELRYLLRHADRRVRQEAHLELAQRARINRGSSLRETGLNALESVAKDVNEPLLARIHALWGLGVVGEPFIRRVLPLLLKDRDAEVRAQAARTLGDWRFEGCAELVPLLKDESPRVRRFAATALGNSSATSPEAVDAILALVRETGESDPWLRHAATYALWKHAGPDQLLALQKDPNVDVRVAAVVALRRLWDARVAQFLDDAEPRVHTEAARAVYDLPLIAAFPALASKLATAGQAPNALARRALNAAYRLGGDENARAITDLAADATARENLRSEALELLARWEDPTGRDGFDGEWRQHPRREASFLPDTVRDLHARGLSDAQPDIARSWVRLVEKTALADMAPALIAMARDTARDEKVRAAAIHALGVLKPDDLQATLRDRLFDAQPGVRAMSLSVFQDVWPGEAFPLLEAALGASIAERRVAYTGFARMKDPRADAALLRELEKLDVELVPAEAALDLVIASEKRDDPALVAALAARKEKRAIDPKLERWVDGLYGGDAARGREIFRGKSELECLRCHMVAGEGGIVGPALDGVGARLSRLGLAESIGDPNRTFATGYQGTVVFQTESAPVEGVVIEDSPERIVLRLADGAQVDIARADVEGTKPGLSAMPENLVEHLSREEMRDLIEYLTTLPPAAPATATSPAATQPTTPNGAKQ